MRLGFLSGCVLVSQEDARARVRGSGAGFSVPSNSSRRVERCAVKLEGAKRVSAGTFPSARASVKTPSWRTRSPYRKPHQEPKVSSLWHDRRKQFRELGKMDF